MAGEFPVQCARLQLCDFEHYFALARQVDVPRGMFRFHDGPKPWWGAAVLSISFEAS